MIGSKSDQIMHVFFKSLNLVISRRLAEDVNENAEPFFSFLNLFITFDVRISVAIVFSHGP